MKKIKFLTLALAAVMSLAMFAACAQKTEQSSSDNISTENTEDVAQNPKNSEQTKTQKSSTSSVTSEAFEIEGKVYSLPCDLSEFFDNGWEYTHDTTEKQLKEKKVEANKGYHTPSSLSLNGEEKIAGLSLYNLGDTETTMDQCKLIGIDLWGDDLTSSSDSPCKFKLFGELDETLTREDLIRVLGSEEDEDTNKYFNISDTYDASKAGTIEYYMAYMTKSDEVKYNYTFWFNKDNTLRKVSIEMPTTVMNF